MVDANAAEKEEISEPEVTLTEEQLNLRAQVIEVGTLAPGLGLTELEAQRIMTALYHQLQPGAAPQRLGPVNARDPIADTVKKFLDNPNYDQINDVDDKGHTCLFYAALRGS